MGARLFSAMLLSLAFTTGVGSSDAVSDSAAGFDAFQPSRESPWLRFDAEFVHSDSATPPQDADWTSVTLPDSWRREERWSRGLSGWYRFRLPDEPPDEVPAVYLYRFSMNAAVYLNDEFIGSGGSFKEPVSRNWNRPLLFSLPRSAWREQENFLYVRLRVYPGFGHLAPPAIGPMPLFERPYWTRFTAQIVFGQVAFLIALLSAGFGVAFWLVDRSSNMYLYFALCGATWSVYSLNLFIQDLPVSARVWWWLVHTAIDAFAVFLVMFAHRLLGVRRPWVEKALWLFLGTAGLVYAGVGIPGIARWNPVLHIGDLVCGVYLIVFLVRKSIRRRSADALVMTASIAIMLALAIHDQVLNALVLPDAWATRYYLLQFASPLMLLVIMIHLARRFRAALKESHRTTEELHRRVTEVSRELAASYEQQRLMHERHAATRERERIYQDLHDEIGGTLLSLVYAAPDDRSRQLAREAIGELRGIVATDPAKGCSLAEFDADMRREVEERLATTGVRLDWLYHEPQIEPHLTGVQRFQLHRVLRELVSNVIKHADATRLRTTLRVDRGCVHLEVVNDGLPFPAKPRSGRGLTGIRKRVARLGGECAWRPTEGGGVCFWLRVPLYPETGGVR